MGFSMSLLRTPGIVIGEVNTGEADKILTIFTKKFGKIQAAVKGARRPKSNVIACSQFLVFSDFIFFKGRSMYSVNSCEVVEPFYNLRNDLYKLTYATYTAEVIREVIHENLPSYRVLQLFLNTLFTISELDKSPELITRAFEFRLMSLIGFKPQVDGCIHCGNKEEYNFFSFEKSGLVCAECGSRRQGMILISEGTAKALKYIINSDIKRLFSFSVPESILNELKLISGIFMKDKLEKDFQTLKFIDKLDVKFS